MGSTPIAGTKTKSHTYENGGEEMSQYSGIIAMVVVLVLMYLLMIRPQRKRDKETNDMRASLTVGDEIVTIGGICGKIVKTKDDSIVIQTGADKLRIEMKRWAVSKVEVKSSRKNRGEAASDTLEEDDAPKKVRPKRMKRNDDIEPETAADVNEPVEVVEAAAEAAETEHAAEAEAESEI